jgi:hypothetical protein
MKISLVGNSHLGALKVAVRRGLFSQKRLDISFWALPGDKFHSITFSAGLLQTPYKSFVLQASNGLYESLPVHEFDAIVFHGVVLKVGDFLLSLRKAGGDLRCYSKALLADCLQSCIEKEPPWSLVRSLRAGFGGRLLLSAIPLTSEDGSKFRGISVADDEFADLNHHIGAVLGKFGVEYVPQPSHTIRDSKYTKREFCVDYIHMNEQYGCEVLQALGALLSAPSSGDRSAEFARAEVTPSGEAVTQADQLPSSMNKPSGSGRGAESSSES